ncbi:GNAT family N-acetyltransferase [Candidatus Clostridium stratigraminis]|uniref:GNAT family N-acetyltransferase n=1 Tax=Candidatus Clostridium stratigraminis TaxID=3381661 RepID=A0ABW8T2H7_9CLOT
MITYKFAEIKDLNLLVSLRLEFLEVVPSNKEYQNLKINIEKYFKTKILSGECTVVLAESNSNVVGTGIMFYYNSVPSVSNMTGKNAYITSMYVHERFRRQMIGSTILTKLLEKAKERDYEVIMLNATDIGRKLYEKHGFTDISNGMIYKY